MEHGSTKVSNVVFQGIISILISFGFTSMNNLDEKFLVLGSHQTVLRDYSGLGACWLLLVIFEVLHGPKNQTQSFTHARQVPYH